MRLSILRLSYFSLVFTVFGFTSWAVSPLFADEPTKPATDEKKTEDKKEVAAGEATAAAATAAAATAAAQAAEKPKHPPYSVVLKDAQKIDGLLTLHRKDEDLYVELKPTDLDKDFIILITIAKGIGQTPILGGFNRGFAGGWGWEL